MSLAVTLEIGFYGRYYYAYFPDCSEPMEHNNHIIYYDVDDTYNSFMRERYDSQIVRQEVASMKTLFYFPVTLRDVWRTGDTQTMNLSVKSNNRRLFSDISAYKYDILADTGKTFEFSNLYDLDYWDVYETVLMNRRKVWAMLALIGKQMLLYGKIPRVSTTKHRGKFWFYLIWPSTESTAKTISKIEEEIDRMTKKKVIEVIQKEADREEAERYIVSREEEERRQENDWIADGYINKF